MYPLNRRQMLQGATAAAVGAGFMALPVAGSAAPVEPPPFVWGNLLHLSYNMWEDPGGAAPPRYARRGYHSFLRFDPSLWNDLLGQMAAAGMNMVVLDLGDGVRYESHPEIAVDRAWSVAELKAELNKVRQLGIEPIPKLNFSTAHDTWLGKYERMVSTDTYYHVVEDLIAEVGELFEKPRFFHLGMDEETAEHQKWYAYSVVRQYDLWWHDLEVYARAVEQAGSRPWVWSDYIWHHRDKFLEEMPTSILQSNWYYETRFDDPAGDKDYIEAYALLEAHGYDQIPTASNHEDPDNFRLTVEHCKRTVAPERLLGFLQTPWRPTLEEFREHHEQAIQQVAEVRAKLAIAE